MTTPIYDFVTRYAASGTARLHMPGHKGRALLGCEALDLTEIAGTEGLIEQSQKNTAALFGSGKTLYSTGGASQCIRAMVYLARMFRPGAPIVAARNVHKSFLYAAALCGAELVWLWPEERTSLCACEIAPEALECALASLPSPPAAVYITSPDYLGGLADLARLSAVCRRHDTPLLVDNAHGAYLKFLPRSAHPLDLGAAMCCDSAHKTLPVLTGGAYLHLSKDAPAAFLEHAEQAMELFSSTSPSWLTLASLDRCVRDLAEDWPARLAETAARLETLKDALRNGGWAVEQSDPLRVTLRGNGAEIAALLRAGGAEPEYADRDRCVLMATPENPPAELDAVLRALGPAALPVPPPPSLPLGKCEQVMSVRRALFSPSEEVPPSRAVGRICAAPSAGCPPAVPPVISGERVSPEAAAICAYYGIERLSVVASSISA